jgi:hypothetical protein
VTKRFAEKSDLNSSLKNTAYSPIPSRFPLRK